MELSDLQDLVSSSLGTTSTAIFTDDKKTKALNWARKHILLNFEVAEFVVESTLTFTSGKAGIPSTYLRTVRLYNSSNKTQLWDPVTVNAFDSDIIQTFTIKDDSGTRKFHVYPTDTTSLTLRYYKLPENMSDDDDDSDFNPEMDEAHAAMAAYFLLQNDKRFEEASAKRTEADSMVSNVLQNASQEVVKSVDSYFVQHTLLSKKVNVQDVE